MSVRLEEGPRQNQKYDNIIAKHEMPAMSVGANGRMATIQHASSMNPGPIGGIIAAMKLIIDEGLMVLSDHAPEHLSSVSTHQYHRSPITISSKPSQAKIVWT